MIDLILISFFVGTAYFSFKAGAKYKTIKDMISAIVK